MSQMKNHKGFTLIEILIATAILVMVGVAAIGVERNFMGSAGVNKHKLQATALAQEGVSAIRMIYNTDLLNSTTIFPSTPGTYYLESNVLRLCSNCDSSHSGVWNISLNNVTFTRTITVP